MKTLFIPAVMMVAALLVGCSNGRGTSPDVADGIRSALDSRGLADVSVSQDRDKGVVTLSGKVPTASDKAAAESVAQSIATGQVIANQVMVSPPGMERDAAAIHNALDDGIESNMKAMLIQMGSPSDMKYGVKAGVVTLTGTVDSQEARTRMEKAAALVPNVTQVVNELQVKEQKATTR